MFVSSVSDPPPNSPLDTSHQAQMGRAPPLASHSSSLCHRQEKGEESGGQDKWREQGSPAAFPGPVYSLGCRREKGLSGATIPPSSLQSACFVT